MLLISLMWDRKTKTYNTQKPKFRGVTVEACQEANWDLIRARSLESCPNDVRYSYKLNIIWTLCLEYVLNLQELTFKSKDSGLYITP